MPKPPSGTNWEFDRFTVLTGRRLLLGEGTAIALTSKAFDTLVVLIENRDRVVTKDELLSSVWPDVEVEEGNLTQQIFLLRKALGESAQQPRHIVTVPGHGYRFTASVLAISDPAATAVPANGAASPPAAPRRRMTLIATGVVAFGVIAALAIAPWSSPVPPDFTRHMTKVTESGKAAFSAISRDGQYVAYIENDGDQYSLWMKPVGAEGKTAIVSPQPLAMAHLSFSLDSRYVYFVRQSARGRPKWVLFRIPTFGGLETPILEDVDSQISFSPDGREFVFQRGANPESHIVVAAAEGGSERILASRKFPLVFSVFAPDWSPDGKIVAAVASDLSTTPPSRSVVLLSLDGGSRELYRPTMGIGRLRWLPDGSGLLTVMGERLERRQFGRVTGGAIWRIEYPSGRAERLTSDLSNHDPCCLDVGADGSVVANLVNMFVSDLWIAPADRLDERKQLTSDHPVVSRHGWLDNDTMVYRDLIGRLNAVHKDGRPFSLPVPDGQEVTLGVSACGDGRYVVFSAVPGRNIWRVAPNGGGPVKLTSGLNDFNPACSPDGKSVLYASREPDYPSLFRVSIEGGQPTPLNVLSSYDVLPSPTGRMIFYQTDWVEKGADSNRPDRWEIISSSDHKRLFAFEPTGDGLMTNWAPDESGLDYVVTRNGVSNIWRQLLTGGPPVPITRFSSGRIFSFAWSPDGQWLSFATGVNRSDVAMMSSEP